MPNFRRFVLKDGILVGEETKDPTFNKFSANFFYLENLIKSKNLPDEVIDLILYPDGSIKGKDAKGGTYTG